MTNTRAGGTLPSSQHTTNPGARMGDNERTEQIAEELAQEETELENEMGERPTNAEEEAAELAAEEEEMEEEMGERPVDDE